MQTHSHCDLTLSCTHSHWDLTLSGGEHFTDIDGGQWKAARLGRRRIALCDINPHGTTCLRTTMLQHVITLDIHRPCPFNK